MKGIVPRTLKESADNGSVVEQLQPSQAHWLHAYGISSIVNCGCKAVGSMTHQKAK